MRGKPWTGEERAYCVRLIQGGEFCTRKIREAMEAKFQRPFGTSGIEKCIKAMGIQRNRKYGAELRNQFKRLCLDNPDRTTAELRDLFVSATGCDLYWRLADMWRRKAA